MFTISSRYKKFLIVPLLGIILLFASIILWVVKLDNELRGRIEGSWFAPPVEIYSAPTQIKRGQLLSPEELTQYLVKFGMRQRDPDLRLFSGDFAIWNKDQCQLQLNQTIPSDASVCVTFVFKTKSPQFYPYQSGLPLSVVVFSGEGSVLSIFGGNPISMKDSLELDSHLFAEFYAGEPILRQIVQIGEVPLYCLQGITAIEDSDFLEHRGISPSGLFRALTKNLVQGRYAQGGSTITQQLIKIYFLNSQKTLKRKITELIMAILLETRIEKDKILVNYLNAVYMGQNGPFQIMGFGAAAQHYFQKSTSDLNLSECALLSAMVNSPGRYSPFASSQNAMKRRQKVLDRMLEMKMISQDQALQASEFPLPQRPPRSLSDPAPYFVQSVEREIQSLQIDSSSGLRVFTTLDEKSQEKAQQTIGQQIERLERDFKSLAQLKAKGKELQATLISVDVASGEIMALVGGRSYKRTQFNRAIDGHRQVGSIMKPFVYLAALESRTLEGEFYNPLTPVLDEAFVYKQGGQKWSPENYDKKFLGTIPLFAALKNSINSATAKLGLDLGLGTILDVARRAGIKSPISLVPSLTLGAFELYPMEVAESYLTLARMGSYKPISQIRRIEDLNGTILYEPSHRLEQRFAPEVTAVLIGMMKQTVLAGTARSLATQGFNYPAAGKTGTTSDTKDAWFAGFTPEIVTVVWVGYDDNTPHGLTGASGALPIWADFMKSESQRRLQRDFDWPEGTVLYPLSVMKYNSLLKHPEDLPFTEFTLVFRTGEQPGF